jgi:hypothetical protein
MIWKTSEKNNQTETQNSGMPLRQTRTSGRQNLKLQR